MAAEAATHALPMDPGQRTSAMAEGRDVAMVDTGDARVATFVEGEGPALVVLPSYGRDGAGDYDGFSARLAGAGWKVLRPQPRGIAGSTGPMQGADLSALSRDVSAVIRRLAGGRAVVLGHAFGNQVARALATEHGDLVSAVVLAAASARHVAADVNETPFVAGDPSRPEAERLAALHRAFFAPGHDAEAWLSGWYPATLAMQRAAVKASDIERFWASGTAPVLEINARFDPFKPEPSWGELKRQFRNRVTRVLIDDAAHALFPEQPIAVADAVLGWAEQFRGP